MDAVAAEPDQRLVVFQPKHYGFGFYSADQVRRMSVKAVVHTVSQDEFGRSIPGGLYDLAMGPVNPQTECATCGLGWTECPGHFGHIELVSPVVHPLLFASLFRVLQSKCWSCHEFRAPALVKRLLKSTLRVMRDEDAFQAGTVSAMLTAWRSALSASAEAGANGIESSIEALLTRVDAEWQQYGSFTRRSGAAGKSGALDRVGAGMTATHVTRHSHAAKLLLKEFYTMCHQRKQCASCGFLQVKLSRRKLRVYRRSKGTSASVLGSLTSDKAMRESADIEVSDIEDDADTPTEGKLDRAVRGEDEMDYSDPVAHAAMPPRTGVKEKGRGDDMSTGVGDASNKLRLQIVPTLELRNQIGKLWEHEKSLCRQIWHLYGAETANEEDTKGPETSPTDLFFLHVLIVPPNRFRPTSKSEDGGPDHEHVQNVAYASIMKVNRQVRESADKAVRKDASKTDREAYMQALLMLQDAVCSLIDPTLTVMRKSATSALGELAGVRQVLEKKTGLFRWNIMGKRTNHSARSVIGPDVFLDTNELGVPEAFARKLTIIESVNAFNIERLTKCVLNGPDVHPGANFVDVPGKGRTNLLSSKARSREAQARQLGVEMTADGGVDGAEQGSAGLTQQTQRKVGRHLRTGDIVLFNRQPSLHRASIMAHRVRVLPGEKTLRMHYANCGSYNADFDGDEMNMYVPQHLGAIAEGSVIALADHQYVTPTSGAPVRGLIQDHVLAGVLLTKRDTFLDRATFQQLLYSAVARGLHEENGQGSIFASFRMPLPAILRPQALWTGKQLTSALIRLVAGLEMPSQVAFESDGHGRGERVPRGIFLTSRSRTKADMVGDETTVIFRDGELLRGVLDKNQFGASSFGLVHAFFELYGAEKAGQLLSCLSRLFTWFLRMVGHTTGVGDLLLTPTAESERARILHDARAHVGKSVLAKLCGQSSPFATHMAAARAFEEMTIADTGFEARVDAAMKSALASVTSSVMESCFGFGTLQRAFPQNGFQLMTGTGAKGSAVNSAQISCQLGQTSLEGARVPRSAAGNTLPCFEPFDVSARAGGFISNRFLTGLKPAEYFLHCMAGREGLIDTAVKTARSGYLQRCLVKHLEGIKLEYDHTVRDADGQVIQFLYGEDGLDPSKVGWLLKEMQWQLDNVHQLRRLGNGGTRTDTVSVERWMHEVPEGWKHQFASGAADSQSNHVLLDKLGPGGVNVLGGVSERYRAAIEQLVSKKATPVASTPASQPDTSKKHMTGAEIERFMMQRYQQSLMQPGEAVGVVAAQSIGEPSTQMTLNTFHFAGMGAAHVTLGIPRLRELLMTASEKPKTPMMQLPLREHVSHTTAERLAWQMRRITLNDLMTGVSVRMLNLHKKDGVHSDHVSFELTLHLIKAELYLPLLNLSADDIARVCRQKLKPTLARMLKVHLQKVRLYKEGRGTQTLEKRTGGGDDDSGDNASEAEIAAGDDETAKHDSAIEGDSGAERDSDAEDMEDGEENDSETSASELNQDASLSMDREHSEDESFSEGSGEEISEKHHRKAHQKRALSHSSVLAGGEVDATAKVDEGVIAAMHEGESRVDTVDEDQRDDKFRNGGTSGDDFVVSDTMEWVRFTQPLDTRMQFCVDWHTLVVAASKLAVVNEISDVRRAFVEVDEASESGMRLTVEGSNLQAAWGYDTMADLSKIYTNDIHATLITYGVEAARALIVRELGMVFEAYGIPVDRRHLMLIADYQTVNGDWRAFNRLSMLSAPSVFQRVTFETATSFLTDSALYGDIDSMANPSAAIALGVPPAIGTGAVALVPNLI
ncbi:DNA-directed RNA polymerase I subunit rpa1 [Porphyridium purpureum]|uniref:DNA-directed RNA polymerase subunit n=1 Tax=Porphyridium purpureum TaxID=35688 RepID=A0A5J4YT59_PORPP|nr:DNA-directed RNA polymerase I subunit rpa1 [Porphyridium purpureum]|eukprot:POR0722..scf229_5